MFEIGHCLGFVISNVDSAALLHRTNVKPAIEDPDVFASLIRD